VLSPGSAARTTLTVSTGADAHGTLVNETTIRAAVNKKVRAETTVKTRLLFAQFNHSLVGIGVGDHKVSPSAEVHVQIGVTATTPFSSPVLTEIVPRAWTVLDAGGGKVTAVNSNTWGIAWTLGNLKQGDVVTKTYTLKSPLLSNPPAEYTFRSILGGYKYRVSSEPWSLLVIHPLTLIHYRIAWDRALDKMDYIAGPDKAAKGIQRFKAFRVRFQVLNDQPVPVRWQPRLAWSRRTDDGFQPLPVGFESEVPFYIRRVKTVANGDVIHPSDFGLGKNAHKSQDGYIFTEQNPGPVLTLNPLSYTEIEFSVRATAYAAYTTDYYFRLTDGVRLIPGQVAHIVMGKRPVVHLTPPQYSGVYVSAPTSSFGQSLTSLVLSVAGVFPSPHSSYTSVTDKCAVCHRTHTGRNRNILPYADPQSQLCFTCHDGTGSNYNIKSQYTDPNVPANDSGTSSFYAHPATEVSTHTNAKNDEFHNVLNRHSECSDCHNPHTADGTLTSSTTNGWTASGALKGISGVGVTNGAAGTTPTFAWKNTITYEYELCFKCHSAYTTLLNYSKESYKKWDKGTEFNPANPSYHPVEAAGKNTTTKMANNLAGPSPYKLWDFAPSSVVRCVFCHGDYRLADPNSAPAGDSRLAPHSSENRSVLMNNYRDRLLKPKNEAYNAADFALCYQCHTEAPYADTSGSNRNDTNFRYHGRHLGNISAWSYGVDSTDIDTAGAGRGNAICSECHFRVHGQGPNARGNSTGSRLINFAPNVQPNRSGQLAWSASQRSCSLKCHGQNHSGMMYRY